MVRLSVICTACRENSQCQFVQKRRNALVCGFLQILLGSVELALKQSDFSLKGITVRGIGLVFFSDSFVFIQFSFEFLKLAFRDRQFVLQRCNLLVLGQQLLLQLLVSSGSLFGSFESCVGLDSERIKFL